MPSTRPTICAVGTILAIVVVAVVIAETFDVDAERGRAQYEMLKADVRMPKYGPCWQAALDDLHEGLSGSSFDLWT